MLCRRATDAADTHLDMLYVNGRYIRYVHIPEGIEIVEAVHRRVQAQTKAQNSHRRTADVIREAIARREAVRGAQLDAISDVPGQTTVCASSPRRHSHYCGTRTFRYMFPIYITHYSSFGQGIF